MKDTEGKKSSQVFAVMEPICVLRNIQELPCSICLKLSAHQHKVCPTIRHGAKMSYVLNFLDPVRGCSGWLRIHDGQRAETEAQQPK